MILEITQSNEFSKISDFLVAGQYFGELLSLWKNWFTKSHIFVRILSSIRD